MQFIPILNPILGSPNLTHSHGGPWSWQPLVDRPAVWQGEPNTYIQRSVGPQNVGLQTVGTLSQELAHSATYWATHIDKHTAQSFAYLSQVLVVFSIALLTQLSATRFISTHPANESDVTITHWTYILFEIIIPRRWNWRLL